MTIDSRIEKIKSGAKCAVHVLKNHKLPYLPDDGSADDIIAKMHNAKSKDQLAEAYFEYIIYGMANGYSDDQIIAGIMQNEAKNNEFKVNLDSIIKSFIKTKYNSVKLDEEVSEIVSSKKNKNPLKGLSDEEIRFYAAQYDPDEKAVNEFGSTRLDIAMGDLLGVKSAMRKAAREWVNEHPDKPDSNKKNNDDNALKTHENKQNKNDSVESKKHDEKSETKDVAQQTNTVEQVAAAHSEISGFNINNFIKQDKPEVQEAPANTQAPVTTNQPAAKPSVFPHQICGLTDDQLVEEVNKHVKVIQELPARQLYDLVKNKYLSKKMKELNSKQRPNNPYLTQVDINEYIDEPELLARYPLAFTMPCNDKGYIIMVLFNPIAEVLPNGFTQYPLHIFKAKLNKNANK